MLEPGADAAHGLIATAMAVLHVKQVEPKKTRILLRLHGRVQGVGFRWWTRREAFGLELAGVVRNRRDGSVEVEAEGEEAAIEALRHRLRQGPAAARVDRVEELKPGRAPLPHPFAIDG